MSEIINAVLVEDDKASIVLLRSLLKKHCPSVNIIGICQNVDESIECINKLKPDVVFLDIMLPDGNGFDILERVEYKSFEIIFTTAHDRFALRAIKFFATHYLLKPFDGEKLEEAVGRLKRNRT